MYEMIEIIIDVAFVVVAVTAIVMAIRKKKKKDSE